LDTITTIILAIFASTGFWTVVNTIYQNHSKKKNAEQQMLIGLGHDRLYSLCNEYIVRGYVTSDELSNLEYIYVPYTELGGNGTGKTLYATVNKLPIKN